MAEELYFIKTNLVAAKINLYNKLCREEDTVLEFLKDDKKTSLELIKKKVLENVESLSKEELLNLINWFKTKYNSDFEEVKTQLFIHGIDVFYEISPSFNVEKFQQILSDYEKYSQNSFKYKFDSEKFNQFLIYGIFFTGLIDRENGQENFLFNFLKSDYQNLYSFAENEFNERKSDLLLQPNIYNCFSDLYDGTKFYKGSIIELHDF
ncbi:hypothetical protein GCM10023210_08910 [Chryseobacterium ginsengisoli]|uniref:Uncharacterized protein n=1 Tax=Chryseobacterium ginsengisoli TaxID=363853 RepID=A0ABP9M1T4_9FLAO